MLGQKRMLRRWGAWMFAAAGVLVVGGVCMTGAGAKAGPKAKPARSGKQATVPASSRKPQAVATQKPQAPGVLGAQVKKLAILYTSDEAGQIRSCNCSKFRFGGYAREATAIGAIRKEVPDVVIVEGGDFLGQPDVPQDKLKAEVSMKAMNALGYGLVLSGENELLFGEDGIAGLRSVAQVPFVSANLRVKATSKLLFEDPYNIVTTEGGVKVAIIGLYDPELLPMSPTGPSAFYTDDPVASLKLALAKVKGKAEFVVVVAHSTYAHGKSLAKVPGVDVVLLAHRESEKTLMPAKDKDTIEAPVETVGKCLLVKSHTRTGWSLGRLDIEIKPGNVKSATNRLVYLTRTFEEDPAIVKLYEEYNAKVQDLVTRQQKQLKDQVMAQLVSHGIDPSKFKRAKTFVSSDECKSCHAEAYDKWQKSQHASAFASLEKRNQGFDPECVSCHSTGATTRGGFTDAKSTPELENVGCEACHGAGASHIAKPAKGFGATGEESCRGCHTDAYSPDFDYDVQWKKIAH